MFEAVKRLWQKTPEAPKDDYPQAELTAEKIEQLEHRLAQNPQDNDAQKALMLEYNRALKIYAKNKQWRSEIDTVFIKMDELRNLIRKNI